MEADLRQAYIQLTGEQPKNAIVELTAKVDGQSGGVIVEALEENNGDGAIFGYTQIGGTYRHGRKVGELHAAR